MSRLFDNGLCLRTNDCGLIVPQTKFVKGFIFCDCGLFRVLWWLELMSSG